MIKTLPEYLNSIENKLDELITLLTPKEVEVITEKVEYRNNNTLNEKENANIVQPIKETRKKQSKK